MHNIIESGHWLKWNIEQFIRNFSTTTDKKTEGKSVVHTVILYSYVPTYNTEKIEPSFFWQVRVCNFSKGKFFRHKISPRSLPPPPTSPRCPPLLPLAISGTKWRWFSSRPPPPLSLSLLSIPFYFFFIGEKGREGISQKNCRSGFFLPFHVLYVDPSYRVCLQKSGVRLVLCQKQRRILKKNFFLSKICASSRIAIIFKKIGVKHTDGDEK